MSKKITKLLAATIFLCPALLSAQDRTGTINLNSPTAKPNTPTSPLKTGRNIALIIGTDEYENQPPLNNPVRDASTIAGILKADYNYEVVLAINPPKVAIFHKIDSLWSEFNSDKFGTNANLFIYIAGHGAKDDLSGGYLVPADAGGTSDTYIDYDGLKNKIGRFKAKHTLLVLDVCNGGTFSESKFSGGGANSGCSSMKLEDYSSARLQQFLQRNNTCPSKKFITSGGDEKVYDGLPGQHSPFAKEFIALLERHSAYQKIVTIDNICNTVNIINTSKPIAGNFGDDANETGLILIPSSIKGDAIMSKHYSAAPPAIKKKSVKVLIMPRQNNYEPLSNTLNDPAVRMAITRITEAFQSKNITPLYFDFTTVKNMNDDKPQILKKSGADLYIEVDMIKGNDGIDAHSVTLTLNYVKAADNRLIATKTFNSGFVRTPNYDQLAARALKEKADEIVNAALQE